MAISDELSERGLPAGVYKKSFSMFFGGGEIWFEHLDGMFGYDELVLKKLDTDSAEFCRPSKPSLIAFNFDETNITAEIENAVAKVLTSGKKRFTRVVFVGADKKLHKSITKKLTNSGAPFAIKFINDFEKAKEWLVSEGR